MAGGDRESKCRVCGQSEGVFVSDSARDDTQQASTSHLCDRAPPGLSGHVASLQSGHSPGGVVTKLSLRNHTVVGLFVFLVTHTGGEFSSLLSLECEYFKLIVPFWRQYVTFFSSLF